MYLLIGIWGGQRRLYASIKFVIYTMVGSLLMLVGIVYVATTHYLAAGAWSFAMPDLYGQHYAVTSPGMFFASPAHWAFAAFALAFAIKAAMFPFHTWLPDAYGEAPAPVTFLLSGVMSKMGIFGFLRVAIPLFPTVWHDFAPLLIALSVTGIIYAALVALAQTDAKRTVAYASVSHLGVILLGVFAATTISVSGSVLLMVGHALTTGALFLLVGFLYERRGTTAISAYGGLTKVLPMFGALFMLVMLASVGLPGLASFVGEFLVFLGAFGAHRTAAIIATVAVILGACYMLWMFQRTMFGPLTHAENRSLPDLTMREGLLFVPIAILIIWIGVYPQMLLNRINPAAATYTNLAATTQVSLNTLGGVR
ncbi:MAG TPA: NADH-quinone oxidoreductase subunit M, partial [Oscillatoriaceae cyanobacterium]